MADQVGLDACKEAYQTGIAHSNAVLIANLVTAKTPEEKQTAIDEFKKAIQICRDARKICEEVCG